MELPEAGADRAGEKSLGRESGQGDEKQQEKDQLHEVILTATDCRGNAD
jgi:hypothetical protein